MRKDNQKSLKILLMMKKNPEKSLQCEKTIKRSWKILWESFNKILEIAKLKGGDVDGAVRHSSTCGATFDAPLDATLRLRRSTSKSLLDVTTMSLRFLHFPFRCLYFLYFLFSVSIGQCPLQFQFQPVSILTKISISQSINQWRR